MKTKITLSIDSGLLRDAKSVADEKGVSLSALLATCLEQVVRGRKTLRTYDDARKRAVSRLRKRMSLNWTPSSSRDDFTSAIPTRAVNPEPPPTKLMISTRNLCAISILTTSKTKPTRIR